MHFRGVGPFLVGKVSITKPLILITSMHGTRHTSKIVKIPLTERQVGSNLDTQWQKYSYPFRFKNLFTPNACNMFGETKQGLSSLRHFKSSRKCRQLMPLCLCNVACAPERRRMPSHTIFGAASIRCTEENFANC